MVPAGDSEALDEGMRLIATLSGGDTLRSKLKQIGDANHDFIRDNFRQSEMNARTIELYESVRRRR